MKKNKQLESRSIPLAKLRAAKPGDVIRRDRHRISFVVQTTSHFFGPFKSADDAALWIVTENVWGAVIIAVRSTPL